MIRTERPRTVVSSTTDPIVAQKTHLGGTVNRIVGSAMGTVIRDDTTPCRPFAVRKITYGFRFLSRSILRMDRLEATADKNSIDEHAQP